MSSKKIIMGVVTVAVAIICVATVMMGALDVADEKIDPTFSNTSDNGIRMSIVESATISKEAGSGTTVTINDKTVNLNTSANAIVLTDTFVINARTTNFYVITTAANNVNAATAFTATIADGTITYQIGSATAVTLSYSGTLLIADPDGEYVNASSGTIYTDGIDKVYGWSWANNKLYVSEGEDCTKAGVSGAAASLGESESSTYESLYSFPLSGVKLDSAGDEVTPVTMIVPASVTVHMEGAGGAMSMLDALPVIVIVAILMGVVAIFLRNRA